MQIRPILMFMTAAVLAIFAGFAGQSWLEQQRRQGQPVAVQTTIATGKIVVATTPLRFGAELNVANVREIEWPAANVPEGAFSSLGELLKSNERRVVLSAIETNEPILKSKITGPGQRASLSAVIEPGKKAVTIRVNDVLGVAGFVLPGDRVDVLLTRTDVARGDDKVSYTDVLIQQARVLGVDQLADERVDKPSVVKAVTLEVGTEDSQRLALAGTVGSLSLALGQAGAVASSHTRRITADELGTPPPRAAIAAVATAPTVAVAQRRTEIVGLTRSVTRREYTVSVENSGRSGDGAFRIERLPSRTGL